MIKYKFRRKENYEYLGNYYRDHAPKHDRKYDIEIEV